MAGDKKLWEPLLVYSPEEIERGFQLYFMGSDCSFFPKPGQIREQILIWRAEQRQEQEVQRTQEYLKANRDAIASGGTMTYADICKILVEKSKTWPDITPDRKVELQRRLAAASTAKLMGTSTVQAGPGDIQPNTLTPWPAPNGESE